MGLKLIDGHPDHPDYQANVLQAGRLLAAGGVVAFPTETVYGLGANADNPSAVERLCAIKGRPPGKSFTYLIPRAEDARSFVETIPRMAEKLMKRYWPGPLTLVLDVPGGGTVGLRVPGHEAARDLLMAAKVRVFGTSANRSGAEPATSAGEIVAAFGDELDLVLDGGPSLLGEASTVVRAGANFWRVERPGAISEEMIERHVNRHLLFLCSGNSCRSPMAAGMCSKMIAENLGVEPSELVHYGFTVISAGTSAREGASPTPKAVSVMRDMGVDISGHKTKSITAAMAKRADHVFVMDASQVEWLRDFADVDQAKVHLLTAEGSSITDPYGGNLKSYQQTAEALRQALLAGLPSLLGVEPREGSIK